MTTSLQDGRFTGNPLARLHSYFVCGRIVDSPQLAYSLRRTWCRLGCFLGMEQRCNLRDDWVALVVLVVGSVLAAPTGSQAQWKTHWTYAGATGAEHWGDLDPEYAPCKTGKEQSPIDIRTAEKAELPALRFEYKGG